MRVELTVMVRICAMQAWAAARRNVGVSLMVVAKLHTSTSSQRDDHSSGPEGEVR